MPTVWAALLSRKLLSRRSNPCVTSEKARATFCNTACLINHLRRRSWQARKWVRTLRLLFEIGGETDRPALRLRPAHELADG